MVTGEVWLPEEVNWAKRWCEEEGVWERTWLGLKPRKGGWRSQRWDELEGGASRPGDTMLPGHMLWEHGGLLSWWWGGMWSRASGDHAGEGHSQGQGRAEGWGLENSAGHSRHTSPTRRREMNVHPTLVTAAEGLDHSTQKWSWRRWRAWAVNGVWSQEEASLPGGHRMEMRLHRGQGDVRVGPMALVREGQQLEVTSTRRWWRSGHPLRMRGFGPREEDLWSPSSTGLGPVIREAGIRVETKVLRDGRCGFGWSPRPTWTPRANRQPVQADTFDLPPPSLPAPSTLFLARCVPSAPNGQMAFLCAQGPLQDNQGCEQSPSSLQEIISLLIRNAVSEAALKHHLIGSQLLKGCISGAEISAAPPPVWLSCCFPPPTESISLLSNTLSKLVYIVFAWLTLYAIELENVVCIVKPLNNVFCSFFFEMRDFSIANETTPYLAQRTPLSVLKHNFH